MAREVLGNLARNSHCAATDLALAPRLAACIGTSLATPIAPPHATGAIVANQYLLVTIDNHVEIVAILSKELLTLRKPLGHILV